MTRQQYLHQIQIFTLPEQKLERDTNTPMPYYLVSHEINQKNILKVLEKVKIGGFIHMYRFFLALIFFLAFLGNLLQPTERRRFVSCLSISPHFSHCSVHFILHSCSP